MLKDFLFAIIWKKFWNYTDVYQNIRLLNIEQPSDVFTLDLFLWSEYTVKIALV